MKNILVKVVGVGYRRLVKPVLFRMSPDNVHVRIMRVLKVAQRIPFFTDFFALFAYKNTFRLSQTFRGITFLNPVGLAAGFDKNAEAIPTMRAIGFGFGTVGSVTKYYCEGNPRPWFYRLPKSRSIVVNVGLANEGVTSILERIRTYQSRLFSSFPVVLSVAKTNSPKSCNDDQAIDDYVGSLRAVKRQLHIRIVELNISCPNAYGGEPFTTPKRLDKLLTAVDSLKIGKPVWVKMPINLEWQEFEKLLKVIVKHDVHGVTIGNLNKDRVTTELVEKLPDKILGNLSGKPTEKLSNTLIGQTYRKYGKKLLIIGVGGIFSADDAYEKIRQGASLVELLTGMIFEGPQVVGEVNKGLVDLLKRDGYKNVSSAIGSAHSPNKTAKRKLR